MQYMALEIKVNSPTIILGLVIVGLTEISVLQF